MFSTSHVLKPELWLSLAIERNQNSHEWLGLTAYTAERQVNDCQKHLRERLCDSGGQILGAAPISHRNAALLQPAKDQKKISSVTEIPTEMKMTEMKVASYCTS